MPLLVEESRAPTCPSCRRKMRAFDQFSRLPPPELPQLLPLLRGRSLQALKVLSTRHAL